MEFECSVEGGVFTMSFSAPRQLLLDENFDSMVWDETLRRAHVAGHIPIGPVMITHAEHTPEPTELREGESLTERMQRWAATNMVREMSIGLGGTPPDLIRVTSSVNLGASLE